jgi:hypothetical protein
MTVRFPKQKIVDVLRASGGVLAAAAQKLRVSRSTLYRWCDGDLELQTALADIREETIDLAETQLHKAIKEGSERSVHYYLDRLGRHRGYTTKLTLASDSSQPLNLEHQQAFDYSRFSTEDLNALVAILKRGRDAVPGEHGTVAKVDTARRPIDDRTPLGGWSLHDRAPERRARAQKKR